MRLLEWGVEWVSLGLDRLETKEGGKGSVAISRAKLGLLGSLPRWRGTSAKMAKT
jgi:hypothetical protein